MRIAQSLYRRKRIWINRLDLSGRFFGDFLLWSPDSRYLAVQEWLTTEEAEGPHTALLVIDFAKQRQCRISEAKRGFICPLSFEGDVAVYYKRYLGTGIIREKEMDLAKLQRWEPSEIVGA